ncbi:MAG: hypothetical protein OXC07_12885 [Kistimonas sp.]|nr:hypothetical protein [Kistimonas sp.]
MVYCAQTEVNGGGTDTRYSFSGSSFTQSVVAAATGAVVQGWQLVRSLSEAAPAAVASVQSGLLAAASRWSPSALKELAERTVAVLGPGSFLLLATPFVVPVLNSLSSTVVRRLRIKRQDAQNARTLMRAWRQRAWEEDCARRRVPFRQISEFHTLLNHAGRLSLRGRHRMELVEQDWRARSVVNYIPVAALPFVMLPQVAAWVGAPAAVPAALGLATAGCAMRWVLDRLDNWRARAEAAHLIRRSEDFADLARDLVQVVWPDPERPGEDSDAVREVSSDTDCVAGD